MKKLNEPLTNEVAVLNARGQVYATRSVSDPVIEFIILVSYQLFIKVADAIEDPPANGGKLRSLSITFVPRKTMAGIADSERVAHGQGDRFAQLGPRRMDYRSP